MRLRQEVRKLKELEVKKANDLLIVKKPIVEASISQSKTDDLEAQMLLRIEARKQKELEVKKANDEYLCKKRKLEKEISIKTFQNSFPQITTSHDPHDYKLF